MTFENNCLSIDKSLLICLFRVFRLLFIPVPFFLTIGKPRNICSSFLTTMSSLCSKTHPVILLLLHSFIPLLLSIPVLFNHFMHFPEWLHLQKGRNYEKANREVKNIRKKKLNRRNMHTLSR